MNDRKPPTSPAALARDLGLSDKQLASMRVKAKTEPKLISRLQKLWKETRDDPRILARRSQQGYTHSPYQGLVRGDDGGAELEAVDELTQKRLTREAHDRQAQRKHDETEGLLLAMGALRESIEAMPDDRKRRMSKTLWTLRSRLDSAERELRRRNAA